MILNDTKATLLANITTAGFLAAVGNFCLTPAGLSLLSMVITGALSAWTRKTAASEREEIRKVDTARARREAAREDRMIARFAEVLRKEREAERASAWHEHVARLNAERAASCCRGQARPDLKIHSPAEPIGTPFNAREFFRDFSHRTTHPGLAIIADHLAKPDDDQVDEPHPNHDDRSALSDRGRG